MSQTQVSARFDRPVKKRAATPDDSSDATGMVALLGLGAALDSWAGWAIEE